MDSEGYAGCAVVFSILLFVIGLLLAKLQARTREIEMLTDRVNELALLVRVYLLPPIVNGKIAEKAKGEK